jgi:hypothetical protein
MPTVLYQAINDFFFTLYNYGWVSVEYIGSVSACIIGSFEFFDMEVHNFFT